MPVANIIELRQLLAERFPGLRTRADELSAARHTFWPTGLPQLDEPLRGGLAKGALAEIGALSCFASHRRDALWEVEKPLRQDDLFESAATATAAAVIDREAASPLAPMNYSERIQADFAGMQLTTGAHPMALLRP